MSPMLLTNQPRVTPLLLALLAGLSFAPGALAQTNGSGTNTSTDPYATLPASLTLTGIVRDFKWSTESNGHADFEFVPGGGYGHYTNMVADQLDSDNKPVFKGVGNKVSTEAKDAAGRNIMPVTKSYITRKTGDTNSSVTTSAGNALTTSARFAQWYRDVPGVNVSTQVPIKLVRNANSNIYTFNDKTDSTYTGKGGFFPINGTLFGNSPGQSKNFGFTFELDTTFVFKQGGGQVFTFTGDDDVWVFIDGKLVVDIGGVHSAMSQTIELDRLNWLEDGKRYSFKLCFAERHTTESNVRIDTTLNLEAVQLPTTTSLAD